ncbi:Uncharacterised protein [Bordetella pertussis]|nr:Uncharacterised protein [Bordetella pertussis]
MPVPPYPHPSHSPAPRRPDGSLSDERNPPAVRLSRTPTSRYPAVGPVPGRSHPGLRGQAGVRHDRNPAPHRRPVSSCRRPGRRQAAAGPRQAIARQRPQLGGARVQLLPAPVQHRRGPRPEPAPARARPGRRRSGARQPAPGHRIAQGAGREQCPDPPPAERGLRDAGADRPPHRSAAQEHAGRASRNLFPAGAARARTDRRRTVRTGPGPDRPGRHAVADAHAALHAADRGRRDRERAVLLPQHLPQCHPARLRRPGPAAQPRARQAVHAAAPTARTVPAHGQLDRRRSRRQSQCRRRHAGTRAAAAGHGAVRALSAGSPRAGRRTVGQHTADRAPTNPTGAR